LRKKKKNINHDAFYLNMKIELWAVYAFVGFFGYFFVNLLLKYVSNESPYLVSLVLYSSAATAMAVILVPKGKAAFFMPLKPLAVSAAIGVFSVVATVYAVKSVKLSPNPGYSAAIYSANFVLVAIASFVLFGSELSLKKIIGIFATLAGLVLLSI